MPTTLRIATFNLENLDDVPNQRPTLIERIAVMRPQLLRLRADILCLQEAHGQEVVGQPRQLLALRKLLEGTPYAEYFLSTTLTGANEVYNERNLVVLSRFPITGRKQIRHDYLPQPVYRQITAIPAQPAEAVTWERPLLYVTIDVNGQTIHVINAHLKSKRPSDIPGQKLNTYQWASVAGWAEGSFLSTLKRVGQALEARILIDRIFDDHAVQAKPDPLIVMCGDLNATSDEVTVEALRGPLEETGNPALGKRVLFACEKSVPDSSRYSLFHRGKGEMLDHVLASRALLQHYIGTQIHNESLPDESGFSSDQVFPESDHAPVVAEFLIA
jgi:endonuclease/exonuclease/phosphatase family metal-dependent hydrolase